MDVTAWDSITIAELRAGGGAKWTRYPDCIGAFVAESDFGVADPVRRALSDAAERSLYGYLTPALASGLREATASWLQDAYGWQVDPRDVRRSAHVLEALETTVRLLLHRPDSAVIVPTPAYMPFLKLPQVLGRRIITVPLAHEREGDAWHFDLDALGRAFEEGGELLLLTNPHNPTGHVFTREELTAVSEVVEAHHGRVFADEVHAPIRYPGTPHVPYATVSEAAAAQAVTATSASKGWNIAGLKCAQLILSSDPDRSVWRKAGWWPEDGPSTLGVIANTAAYADARSWIEDQNAYLLRNRARLGELLNEYVPHATWTVPEATYLAWIDLSAYELPASPAVVLRSRAHVAVVPGTACGPEGDGHIRLNFATPLPILEQLVERIGTALAPFSPDR